MPASLIRIVAILTLVVLSLALLANSMSKPAGRDEQMYCTAGVLLAQGKMIYRDFSYAAQTPCHPLLCAGLYKISGTTHYLLVARLLSCACDILTMACIVGIYLRVFKPFTAAGLLLALAACVLYVFNPLADYTNGYAWNHDVVILCVMASLWLFVGADSQRGQGPSLVAQDACARRAAPACSARIAAIGALLTFATWMRVTTALVQLLFLVMVLSLPAKSIGHRCKAALPFIAASVLVSLWPIWVIAQAPRAFYLNLIKIPALYGRWLHEIGMVFSKFDLTFACLTRAGYLVLILLAIYLFAAVAVLRGKLKFEYGRSLLLAGLLPVVFFVIALIPPTMWQQYLGVPVPFLAVSVAFPLSLLRRLGNKGDVGKQFRIAGALTGLAAVVAVLSYPQVLYRTPLALLPEQWAPIEMHKTAKEIAGKTKEPKQVLTLAPLLALEGGCDIYTELSAGAIIYRIADSLSPQERQITHTAGPQSLLKLLADKPPSAVVLGVEMQRLETPIYESVVQSDWKKENYRDGPAAYFKP